MKKILLMVCVSFMSTQIMAASWRYGCIGTLSDDSAVNFNSAKIGLLSQTPPALYAATVDQSKDIQVFEAVDLNSGLQREMEFRKPSGAIVKLIQTTSRLLTRRERREACTGSGFRDLIDIRTLKTYRLVIPGEPTRSASLRCYDITISTCG